MSYVLSVPDVAPNPKTRRRKRKSSGRKRTTRRKSSRKSSRKRTTRRKKRNPTTRRRSRRRARRNPKVFGVDLMQALTLSGTAVGLEYGLKQLFSAKYRTGFMGAGIKAAFGVVVGMGAQKLKLVKPSTAKTIQMAGVLSGLFDVLRTATARVPNVAKQPLVAGYNYAHPLSRVGEMSYTPQVGEVSYTPPRAPTLNGAVMPSHLSGLMPSHLSSSRRW